MSTTKRTLSLRSSVPVIVFILSAFSASPVLGQAALENPAPDSAQSGIGVISGWACDANQIEIEFDNDSATRLRASYGTLRADTQGQCGDTDTGFGLLFNWNLLGDGAHTVRASADGVEFASVAVLVTTLEEEFRRGVSGEFPIADFPTPGDTRTLRWQEAQQNFVITDGSPAGSSGGTSGDATKLLENPQPGSAQSGIGVISGWACDASQIEIEFNNDPATRSQAGYGTLRADTQGQCGDTNNGFGLLFNWNLLGDGVHTVRALADGMEFATVTVTVATLGSEFVRGATHDMTLSDFPEVGTDTRVQWQEAQQNFVITATATTQRLVAITPTLALPRDVSIPNVDIWSLYTDSAEVPASPEPSLILATDPDGTVLLAIAGMDGGLLGEAPGRVNVSVESTAVVLIGLTADIAVHEMTQSVVDAIRSHTQYPPVIAAMSTRLAADKNFLDRLYEFSDIVTPIQSVADSLRAPRTHVVQAQRLTRIPARWTPASCTAKLLHTATIIWYGALDLLWDSVFAAPAYEAILYLPKYREAYQSCAHRKVAEWKAANPGKRPPNLPGTPGYGQIGDIHFNLADMFEFLDMMRWRQTVLDECVRRLPGAMGAGIDESIRRTSDTWWQRHWGKDYLVQKENTWFKVLEERLARLPRATKFGWRADASRCARSQGGLTAAGRVWPVGEAAWAGVREECEACMTRSQELGPQPDVVERYDWFEVCVDGPPVQLRYDNPKLRPHEITDWTRYTPVQETASCTDFQTRKDFEDSIRLDHCLWTNSEIRTRSRRRDQAG